MGLQLSEQIQTKLTRYRKTLEDQLGFDLTDEMTVAYLLRDVPSPRPAEWEAEAEAFMRAGQKISAIKLCREKTNLGLKDAKDLVEQKWQHLYTNHI